MQRLRRGLAPLASRQFLVFLGVGGACAAVNLGTGMAVRSFSTAPAAYTCSLILGFAVATVVSFFLNRSLTFDAAHLPTGPQALRFAIVAVLAIGLAAAVGELLLLLMPPIADGRLSTTAIQSVTHVGSIGVVTIYNFVAMKYFALRTEPRPLP